MMTSARIGPARPLAACASLIVLVALAATPAPAAERRGVSPPAQDDTGGLTPRRSEAGAPGALFAWSLKKYFSGVHSRGRVVQVCTICMFLALFILMRKLAEPGPGRRRRPGDERRDDSRP